MRFWNGKKALCLFIVLLLLGLAACGGDDAPQPGVKEKPVIGLLLYRQDDVYIGMVAKALQEETAGDYEVKIAYAESDQMLQFEQIEAMLKDKVDALALNIVEIQASSKAVDAIKKAGIPVVFFNREPELNGIKSYASARFVGTTAYDAGIMQGNLVAQLWRQHPEYDRNQDGKCQYLMIQANLDNPEALARSEFSVKQARAAGVNMEPIGGTLFCSWDDKLAYEVMALVFPYLQDDLELIVSNNDSMALGAIRLLNEYGYNLEGGPADKNIPVVGVDAVPAARQAIQKGIMSGTVVQDSKSMGKTIAIMLRNSLTGKDWLHGVPYPWDDSGIAVRIPYGQYTGEE